jgi:murein DD-endopeptidase MepM/ murein hydrolase activator NlpD
MRRYIGLVAAITACLVFTACTQISSTQNLNTAVQNSNSAAVVSVNSNTSVAVNLNVNTTQAVLPSPLARSAERITKKSFGTYVTPKNSPVQPERFTGYHTGADFETFASEAKIDVPVVAACTGKIRAVQTVSGYGGVLVQDCTVAGQKVTALYGHLRLSSISVKVGTILNTGTQFAVLGTGFSSETSGERKHLHFSLHKGTTISWKGYVSTKTALGDWLDPMIYLTKT